jgi:histidinol-phosphate aminotransferase
VGTTALTSFLEKVPRDVVVVIDEAYREFVRNDDASSDTSLDPVPDGLSFLDRPNVIVLRTFSKAYGLAGLRVGYGIAADPALTKALKQTQVPFAVTHVAQQAALASLAPAANSELLGRLDEVVAERTRVRQALLGFGYDVAPTQANFVWLPLDDGAADFAQGCEERGVIVRSFAGSGVRITIGDTQANDLFLDAARALVKRTV